MIQVTGVLKDPMGNPLIEDTIRITSLDSIGNTVEGSEAIYITGLDGSYDFSLEIGEYRVEINYEDEFHLIGSVVVEENTPTPVTLNYLVLVGTPVVPPVIIETDPNWTQLFNDVMTEGTHRDNQQQIREGDLYTAETKENWKSSTAQMSDESLESNTGNSNMVSQIRTYSDDNLNQASTYTHEGTVDGANTYSSMEAYKASNGKHEVKITDQLSTAKGSITDTSHVTDDGLTTQKSVTFETAQVKDEAIGSSDSLAQTHMSKVGSTEYQSKSEQTPTHIHESIFTPHPRALQEASLKIAETISSVLHTAMVTDRAEVAIDASELARALKETGLVVYDKEAFQRLTIEGGQSKQTTQVDNYLVQDDEGNTVIDIDTPNKKLKVHGRLEVSNPEDFKGDTGDTYDVIFQYSKDNGSTDPWEASYEVGDKWRRERKTLNGTEIGVWSDGYYIFAEDGKDGDVYYNQYQYSTDDASKAREEWHGTYIDGDDWRRWRVIENGTPVSSGHQFYGPENGWFEERMKGLDGPAGWVPHLQYQYSLDGLPPWHNDFTDGDAWRREKVDWYASNQDFLDKDDPVNPSTPVLAGTWTSGVKISPVDGEDYGDKYATVIMYQRSNSDTPPADPNPITFNFNDLSITPSTSNGWSATIPDGEENIWIAVGTAHSRTNEDIVDTWAVERQVVNGYKSAIGWLYQVTDKETVLTNTDLPTQPLEYNFLTGRVNIPTDTSWLKGWSTIIPDNSGDETKLWVTHNTALAPVADVTDTLDASDWEDPVVLAKSGKQGTSGSGWYYLQNVPSSWFLSAESLNWATYGKDNGTNSIKYLFNQAFGKDPIEGDVVSVSTVDGLKSDTGLYNETADSNRGAFEYVASLINGNMIVDGSLRAQKIRANAITGDKINSATTIIAGSGSTTAGMNGDDVDVTYKDYRFWAGASTPAGAPWRVKSDGSVVANNIAARGSLTAGNYEGGEGVLIDDQGNITSGNYVAGASGYQLKKNGDVDFNDGNFRGTVRADKILGDVVSGADEALTRTHLTQADVNVWREIISCTVQNKLGKDRVLVTPVISATIDSINELQVEARLKKGSTVVKSVLLSWSTNLYENRGQIIIPQFSTTIPYTDSSVNTFSVEVVLRTPSGVSRYITVSFADMTSSFLFFTEGNEFT